MRWARCVIRLEDMKNAYKICIGKSDDKKLFPRLNRGQEHHIEFDLK